MNRPDLSLPIIIASILFFSGCSVSHIVTRTNGDFASGLAGWEVRPPECASIVGDERILDIALSSGAQVHILKKLPLSARTELVKISFRVRYRSGSMPWSKAEAPSFWFNLQEPADYGNYNSGMYLVNPYGNWETHEIVQMYTAREAKPTFARLRALPTELVFRIIIEPGYGRFQFDDFRVEELVTTPIITHQ